MIICRYSTGRPVSSRGPNGGERPSRYRLCWSGCQPDEPLRGYAAIQQAGIPKKPRGSVFLQCPRRVPWRAELSVVTADSPTSFAGLGTLTFGFVLP